MAPNLVSPPPRQKWSLGAQHPDVQKVVQAAFKPSYVLVTARSGWPNISDVSVIRGELITAAKQLDWWHIHARLLSELAYGTNLAKIVAGRSIHERAKLKATASNHVQLQYGIGVGVMDTSTFVQGVLPSHYYIYPRVHGTRGLPRRTHPYMHPIFPIILHYRFFSGDDNYAARYPSIFNPNEALPRPEIPRAMLTLVGAVVHTALSQWSTGELVPRKFSEELCGDATTLHMRLLNAMWNRSEAAYHDTMANLYIAARDLQIAPEPADPDATAPNDDTAVAELDLEGWADGAGNVQDGVEN
ncbi:hypothetical protein BOTBODRAFT_56286 [Botryobasidium botryosum FD-172 SS1]|uniref:DUF6532 domain-containing protein n=1 Tax=Botryobasidium botryosum (strain FD-172 SS1) TaxID=930990 RepID=A0A067MMY7_BOTB1|nr:hypothetical protein BOTBODRAFT_56286 [Botryobasidium botryosum FD-172 SS1]